MKKSIVLVAMMLVASAAAFAQSKVYLTREISPESLVRIYKALGVPAKGRVAVKMSTVRAATRGPHVTSPCNAIMLSWGLLYCRIISL